MRRRPPNWLEIVAVLALLWACLGSLAFGQEYRHGYLNGRTDGQNFAPTARVGVYFDCRYSGAQTRGNPLIDPNATAEQRKAGVCANWEEWFRTQFDPIHAWVSGNGQERNGLFVFESPHGLIGAYRRDHTIDERERAIAYGKPWLVEGFIPWCRLYVDGGAEIVVHEGTPDLGRWAGDLINQDTPAARATVLRTITAHDAPLVEAGITIGHDAMSSFGDGSVSKARWDLLQAIGAGQQMEATFDPRNADKFRGATCFVHWSSFSPWHVAPQAEYAGPNGWKMPLVGSKEFADFYGEVRVVVPYNFGGSGAQTKDNIEHQADECRKLLALAPNIRVLLIDWIVRGAMQAGVPIERFLPEGSK